MNFTLQRKRIDTFPEEKLFAEMERIWRIRGHRPSRTEWEASGATIHYNTYRLRFGGWMNACVKFIENRMGASLASTEHKSAAIVLAIPTEAKRQIPLGGPIEGLRSRRLHMRPLRQKPGFTARCCLARR